MIGLRGPTEAQRAVHPKVTALVNKTTGNGAMIALCGYVLGQMIVGQTELSSTAAIALVTANVRHGAPSRNPTNRLLVDRERLQ
jgi:hypothetical protein